MCSFVEKLSWMKPSRRRPKAACSSGHIRPAVASQATPEPHQLKTSTGLRTSLTTCGCSFNLAGVQNISTKLSCYKVDGLQFEPSLGESEGCHNSNNTPRATAPTHLAHWPQKQNMSRARQICVLEFRHYACREPPFHIEDDIAGPPSSQQEEHVLAYLRPVTLYPSQRSSLKLRERGCEPAGSVRCDGHHGGSRSRASAGHSQLASVGALECHFEGRSCSQQICDVGSLSQRCDRVEPNVTNAAGNSALFLAIIFNHLEVVLALLASHRTGLLPK